MKQLVILSGKGGTGKTSVAAAFAHLAHEGPSALTAVLADADVDAANLELMLVPKTVETHAFAGGSVAVIDAEECTACGACHAICRFDAVLPGDVYAIDPIACDGCAACTYVCPSRAIRMEVQTGGFWVRSDTRYGPLFHAALRPAQENSGKLVTLVKQQARLYALDGGHETLIVDGPPGIGCPVISAASGADLALIVAEPTLAGIHDMRRALETTAHFRVPALVCLNKWDIYPAGAQEIESFCRQEQIDVVGRIPYDPAVTDAVVRGVPVTALRPDAPASRAIARIWQAVVLRLGINSRSS
jgi:MinD superfamily P-loop ATPase